MCGWYAFAQRLKSDLLTIQIFGFPDYWRDDYSSWMISVPALSEHVTRYDGRYDPMIRGLEER